MNKQEYMSYHKKFCEDMIAITEKKNADYSGSGQDPFANFRHIENLVGKQLLNAKGTGPVDVVAIGFLTRMSDKMSRIGSFIANGELQVKDESIKDTLKDMANYSALFSGYLESKMPEFNDDAAGITQRIPHVEPPKG